MRIRLVAALVLLLPLESNAGTKTYICNNTHANLRMAIAYCQGLLSCTWHAVGWYAIAPGSCWDGYGVNDWYFAFLNDCGNPVFDITTSHTDQAQLGRICVDANNNFDYNMGSSVDAVGRDCPVGAVAIKSSFGARPGDHDRVRVSLTSSPGASTCVADSNEEPDASEDMEEIAKSNQHKFPIYKRENAPTTTTSPSKAKQNLINNNIRSLSADGKVVSYWSSSSQKSQAFFQFSSKGFRNTYILDCAARRYLWVENFDISNNRATDNNASAKWNPINPKSLVANAVFDVVCR